MDKSRQQFEEEFKKHSTLDKDDIFKIDSESDDYYYLATRQAWYWWQVSRESLINSLEPVGYIDNAEFSELQSSRVCYLYKDSIDKINIPLYRLDK